MSHVLSVFTAIEFVNISASNFSLYQKLTNYNSIVSVHIRYTGSKQFTNNSFVSEMAILIYSRVKDYLARNQDNVSEWGDMSFHSPTQHCWSRTMRTSSLSYHQNVTCSCHNI
jgi:hypothetical protein